MVHNIKLRKVARRSETISDRDENPSPAPTPADFSDVDSEQSDIFEAFNGPGPSWVKKLHKFMDLASTVIILAEVLMKTQQNPCEEPTVTVTVFERFVFLYFMSNMVFKLLLQSVWRQGYLNNPWDKLDALIICAEVLDYVLKRRGFDWRISQPMKPLRLVSRLKLLKNFVIILLEIILSAWNIFTWFIIIICIFSIAGVQMWAGQLRNRCFLGGNISSIYNVSLNPYFVSELGDSDPFICSVYGYGTQHCSDVPRLRENGQVCLLDPPGLPQNLTSPTSARMNQNDCVNWNTFYNVCRPDGPNPYLRVINFDNLGSSFLTIFQVISLEGWTDIMYLVMAPSSSWIFLLFIFITGFGSYVFLSTCTVVIATYFAEFAVHSEEESLVVAFFRKLMHIINEFLDNLWIRDMEQTEDRQPERGVFTQFSRYERLREFVIGPLDKIMLFVVFLCSITMVMDHHGQSATWTWGLHLCDIILTSVFVLEFALKLQVYRVSYFADLDNLFNVGILYISLYELCIGKSRQLSVLRSFRMLRILKVIQSMPYLKGVLNVLKRSMKESASLGCFVLLFIYVSSIIGMNIFGCKFEYAGGDLINDRKNFDSLIWAMVTVFQVLTQEDWNFVLYNAMAVTSPFAAFYFVALSLFGKNILFNILVGIVVDSYKEQSDEDEEEDDTPVTPDENPLANSESPMVPIHQEEVEQSNPQEDSELRNAILNAFLSLKRWHEDHEDWSLFLFSPTNKVRCFCLSVGTHKLFYYGILACIIINIIAIGFERPGIGPNSTEQLVLNIVSSLLTAVFMVEMFIMVIAFGFVLGKGTYCRYPWNLLDGIIVLCSTSNILMTLWGAEKIDALGSLRCLRILRIFRFLRMARQARRLQMAVDTLITSVKPMAIVGVICSQFVMFFAILGVQLFKGKFFYCVGEDLSNIKNKTDCLEAGYQWRLKEYNFDNFMNAIITLFVMFTKDGWVRIMYDGLDGVETDQQPVKDYNMWMLVYFLSFMVLSFFLFDMIIGVIVDTYQNCLDLYGNVETLSPSVQDNEFEAPDFLSCGTFRRALLSACKSQCLEIITITIIVINMVLMGFEHYKQPKYIDKLIEYTFIISTIILFIELVMKVIAFGPKRFFKDGWNLLDIFVILSSVIDIVFSEIKMPQNFPFNAGILRICRVFRLTQAMKEKGKLGFMKIILKATTEVNKNTLKVMNIFFLLLLFSLFYAAVGVQLFSNLDCSVERPCFGLHRFSNFRSFPMALLTLYKVSTGDNWSGVLKDCLNSSNKAWIAPAYFLSFMTLVQFFIINLIVAAIVAVMEESQEAFLHSVFHSSEVATNLHASFPKDVNLEEEGREGARRDNPGEDNSNERGHLQRGQVQRDCFEVISLDGDSP